MEFVIFELVLSFILVMYADPSTARNVVDNIILFFHNFLRKAFLSNLEKDVLYIIENSEDKREKITRIKEVFREYSNVLEKYMSETNRFNQLKLKHGYRDPIEIQLTTKMYK